MKKSLGTMAFLLLLCPTWALARTVYFNPDGGRYFHADPHCASISETYWADMRETTEEEAMQRGLSGPCPECMLQGVASSPPGQAEISQTASGLTGSGHLMGRVELCCSLAAAERMRLGIWQRRRMAGWSWRG